jgi:hypothetical protein
MAKTIVYDFDGTIHPYTAGWIGSVPADEPPIPGARESLERCLAHGYRVVVQSSRADHALGLKGITDWLTKHDLVQYVEEVTALKPPAVAYVDDRGVPYQGDWDEVWAGIQRLDIHG